MRKAQLTAKTPQRSHPAGHDAPRYWWDSLIAAAHYVDEVHAHAVQECKEPLYSIPGAAQTAGVSIVCPDDLHPVGRKRDHRLRSGNIQPLLDAAAEFNRRGMTLVIEDALRSFEWQKEAALSDHIIDWFARMAVLGHPAVSDREVERGLSGIIAPTPQAAGHMAGAAVDVSVRLADGCDFDRGGRYLDLSERMSMGSPFISSEQREARQLVTSIMETHGFYPYRFEFWHYSRGDAHAAIASGSTEPARYGPVEFDTTGTVKPVQDRLERLNDTQLLTKRVRAAMTRIAQE